MTKLRVKVSESAIKVALLLNVKMHKCKIHERCYFS